MKKILSSKAKIINWVRAQEPKLELAPALLIEKMKKKISSHMGDSETEHVRWYWFWLVPPCASGNLSLFRALTLQITLSMTAALNCCTCYLGRGQMF